MEIIEREREGARERQGEERERKRAKGREENRKKGREGQTGRVINRETEQWRETWK